MRQGGERLHPALDRAADPDARHVGGGKAGQGGDGQEQRGGVMVPGFLAGGRQHGSAAARVQCQHVHPKPARRPDGPPDGVGDVVELKVQEQALAAPADLFHQAGALGREEFQADLEIPDMTRQPIDGGQCGRPVGDVQRHDQA